MKNGYKENEAYYLARLQERHQQNRLLRLRQIADIEKIKAGTDQKKEAVASTKIFEVWEQRLKEIVSEVKKGAVTNKVLSKAGIVDNEELCSQSNED